MNKTTATSTHPAILRHELSARPATSQSRLTDHDSDNGHRNEMSENALPRIDRAFVRLAAAILEEPEELILSSLLARRG